MDEPDICGKPESPLPVHQDGSSTLLAFERLPSESSGSDSDDVCNYHDQYFCPNVCDPNETQSCGAMQLLTDCGDVTCRKLEMHTAAVVSPHSTDQPHNRRSSVAATTGDAQSCHIWSTRKSVRELYGKPSWWGDDTEPFTAPATPVGSGPNVKMIREQNTTAHSLLTDIQKSDACEIPLPRKPEVFLIDFGDCQIPGIRSSSTSGDLSQCVPHRIRRAFDERERQKKERELQKEQLRRQSADKLELRPLGTTPSRTSTRAPLSARSAVPTVPTKPFRVLERPSTTGPMRSHVSTPLNKTTPQKSMPVTPRSDVSSRLRPVTRGATGAVRGASVSVSSPSTTNKAETRVATKTTPRLSSVTSSRLRVPLGDTAKRDTTKRTLATQKATENSTNSPSIRHSVKQTPVPSRAVTSTKQTPAKVTPSATKTIPPNSKSPLVATTRVSTSGTTAVSPRSITQRSSVSTRGTRSFMSGTASSGAKCVRAATTHTDHSTASSRQMSAPIPCNSIKKPITSTRLRQPARTSQCRTNTSSRSAVSTFTERRSVQFKFDKPKSLDWTSTLLAELETYDDPKAYLFHRMFQGSEHAEAIIDDTLESVISLSFSSSHKAVSPPNASTAPDPTLPDDRSQNNSSLPVRCFPLSTKPSQLDEVNGKLPGAVTKRTANIPSAINLNEQKTSAPTNLPTSTSVITHSVAPHRKIANGTLCPIVSHASPTLREPLRVSNQATSSSSLSSSMLVSASAISLAPSDTGTYILETDHKWTNNDVLHQEPEHDSLTPRGSLINLADISQMPPTMSSTEPLRSSHRHLNHSTHKSERSALSRHLEADSTLTPSGTVSVATGETGISIGSSVHSTKAVTCRADSELDLTTELVHTYNVLNDSLLVSASVISLAPSCSGTYVLDVDDTLASQGVPPVVIQSREDLLSPVEVPLQTHHCANSESLDNRIRAQNPPYHHHHPAWLTTNGDHREDDLMVHQSTNKPPSQRQPVRNDDQNLAVTNVPTSDKKACYISPHGYTRSRMANDGTDYRSLQAFPNLHEVIRNASGLSPVEVDDLLFEIHEQSETFRDVTPTVQSAHVNTHLSSNTTGISGRLQPSVMQAQLPTQRSSSHFSPGSTPISSESCSRPSAYPIRLPYPSQSPTLSSDSSPATQKSTTSPFTAKSIGPIEHRMEKSPLLISSTRASLAIVDPLAADIHDCYEALQASVDYLVRQNDGSVDTKEHVPSRKLGFPEQSTEFFGLPLRPLNWAVTPSSTASNWPTGLVPFSSDIQRTRWKRNRYGLQHQSTASLDSALDIYRDILSITRGNHPITKALNRNGSASVPQPSSPSVKSGKSFRWAASVEIPRRKNVEKCLQAHVPTASSSGREARYSKLPPRTLAYSFSTTSASLPDYRVTDAPTTSGPCGSLPVPDSRTTGTYTVDSRTFTVRRKVNQDLPGIDSNTYQTWMAEMTALSEGIDNLAQTQLFGKNRQPHPDLPSQTSDQQTHCELPDSTTGPLASDTSRSAFITPIPQKLAACTFKDALDRVYDAPDYPSKATESETTTGVGTSLNDPMETTMYYTLMVNSIRQLSLKLRQCSDKLIERVHSEHPDPSIPVWSSSVASCISSTDSVSNSAKYALNDALKNMRTINEQLKIVDKLLFAENQTSQEMSLLSEDHHTYSDGSWNQPQTVPSGPERVMSQFSTERISSPTLKREDYNNNNDNNKNGTPSNFIDQDEEYY